MYMSNCVPVYKNALQTWWAYRRNKQQQRVTDNSTSVSVSIVQSDRTDERPPTFLDFAKRVYNGKYQDWIVEDVKLLRNAFIIVFLIFSYKFIFYQVKENSRSIHCPCFLQLYGSFAYQAMTMKNSTSTTNNFILMSEFLTVISKILSWAIYCLNDEMIM